MGVFSQYYANSGLISCNLVIQIFWYLARTLDLRITFESDTTDELNKYTDSDWQNVKSINNQKVDIHLFFFLD